MPTLSQLAQSTKPKKAPPRPAAERGYIDMHDPPRCREALQAFISPELWALIATPPVIRYSVRRPKLDQSIKEVPKSF